MGWAWLGGGACGGLGRAGGLVEPGDVDGGLGFGDGAVVGLDLCGLALDQEMLVGGAAGGDYYSLGYGVGVGVDGYGDFGGGVAVVGDGDGD